MANGTGIKRKKGQKTKQTQAQIARREIVAKLFKRGYTEKQIQAKVKEDLGLRTYSGQTVHADIVAIKKLWQEQVIEDVDFQMRLELQRIDDIIVEAWEAWDKSKTDFKSKYKKQKGEVEIPKDQEVMKASIRKIEQGEKDEICYGDPRYLKVIGDQLAERRKLIGLYAPEKKDINGEFSFLSFLIDSSKE